ncbi:MFS transporter [Streptomyces sp. NPDC058374]|uniref:MFS transporter n=1 Tax=Streptomyces sp. NPDC058374 TaxID=3346466 RepID=UPI00365F0FFA
MATQGADLQGHGDRGPAASPAPLRGAAAFALVATLVLGVISYQLNASMVTPALPDMAGRLGGGMGEISRVSSLFFLAGSVAGVVFTRYSDFIGRRRTLLLVLGAACAGTLICVLAPNMPVLLLGRVLQGAASAAFQMAYVILHERLDAKGFATSLGAVTAINGGVAGVDGYVGGMLSDAFGFRAIFGVTLLTGVVAAVCVARFVPDSDRSPAAGRMDWWGAAALAAVLIGVTNFISNGSSEGWGSPVSLAYLVATAVACYGFHRIESRRESPLIAVRHLKSRQVWPVVATTVVTLSAVFAVMNFTIVVISQDDALGFGLSAADSALLFLVPAALIGLISAPLAGWLAASQGWFRILHAGMVLTLGSLVVLAVFPLDQWVAFAAVAMLGVSYNGLFMAGIHGLSVLLSPEEAPAALPGINGAAYGIGASVGTTIVAPFVAQETAGGYATALWIAVAVAALALATSLFIAPPRGRTTTM